MLAPGEYLLNPDPIKPTPTALNEPTSATTSVVALTTIVNPVEEPEERPSFLLILLRALGAVHT